MSALRTPLLCAILVLLAVSAQKAPRFKACKRNQPAEKLNECVRDSLQKAVPELVKGIPEYGLKTIDPLRVESVVIPKGPGKISVDLTFKSLDISGLRSAQIKSVEMDVGKSILKTKIDFIEPVTLYSDYKINGKVLVLPIEGSGKCNVTVVNMKAEILKLHGKLVNKKGKEYAEVTTLKFVIHDADRVHYYFENLFNGNKELGDNMNLVLNENWREVFEDMRGPIQSAMEGALKAIIHNVIHRVPYNKIFP